MYKSHAFNSAITYSVVNICHVKLIKDEINQFQRPEKCRLPPKTKDFYKLSLPPRGFFTRGFCCLKRECQREKSK